MIRSLLFTVINKKSSKVYNPKRKGANSYKIKVSFIEETDELVIINLYPGEVHSNEQLIDFSDVTIDNLGENTIL